MAGLEAIRDAIKTTLEAEVAGLHAYDTVPDATHVLPCVVVMPTTASFDVAMGRGVDTWYFDLLVMVAAGEMDTAQDALDELVTGAGPRSIRQAIWSKRTLGLADVDAHVSGMTGYGLRAEAAGIDHLGARLALVVHTKGTA